MHGLLSRHLPPPVVPTDTGRRTIYTMRHNGVLYGLLWRVHHDRGQYEWCHQGDHTRPVTNLWLVNALWSQYINDQG